MTSVLSNRKKVMTVLGPITPEELGITLMHEHLHCDLDWPGLWPDAAPFPDHLDEEVNITNIGLLRRDPFVVRDNCQLTDVEMIAAEVSAFKQAGGSAIVELTTIGFHPNPRALREIAERTGLNIIIGCGWYIGPSHPPYVEEATVAELTDHIVRDLTEGVNGTGIRPGIIGEIGTSGPIQPNEEKAIRAALCAQRETGAAVNIHFSSREGGIGVPRIMEIVREEQADPQRIIFSHMDIQIKPEYYLAAADAGFYIEFDTFGPEQYFMLHPGSYSWIWYQPTDIHRIEGVVDLLERGYVEQVLLSQDIYLKSHLRRYGGWGYDHLLTNVVPMMLRAGITQDQIDTMLIDNPARVLPF